MSELRFIHKTALRGMRPTVPADAEVLSVGMQGDELCAWYTTSGTCAESRSLWVVATGCELDSGKWRHVGTVQDGSFVWHVFDPQTPECG